MNTINFSILSSGDLVNLPSLAGKLNQPQHAISIYLKAQLTASTVVALVNYQDSEVNSAPFQMALVQDINKVICSQGFFDLQRFSEVSLRPETRKLSELNPQGETLQRLNRLLLEDAYPLEILRHVHIFVSSPGDVDDEREIAARVISRLKAEFDLRVRLHPFFWSYHPMEITKTFQGNIPPTSLFDVVICILWSRLGTPLTSPDGVRYASGTELEVATAMESWRETSRPKVLIYINRTRAPVDQWNKQEREQALEQLKSLGEFQEKYCKDPVTGEFIGGYNTYRDLGTFEESIEKHLRHIIQEQDPTGTEAPPPPTWLKGSPFLGLETFSLEHAPVFFGRTKAVGEVIAQLRCQAEKLRGEDSQIRGPQTDSATPGSAVFVLIAAMSGVGKSSLVLAGVLPMLLKSGNGLWRYATMRPGNKGGKVDGDVFDGLAHALLQPEALPEMAQGVDAGRLAASLRDTPTSITLPLGLALAHVADLSRQKEETELLGLIAQTRRDGREHDIQRHEQSLRELVAREARLVLYVDQFEEIFTLTKTGNTPDIRRNFVSVLASLARSGRVWIIATMRSDYLGRCAELPELMILKEGNGFYDLALPTRDEIGQMIQKPALAAGLRYEKTNKDGADLNLDRVLLDAAFDNPEALPLLEYCLHQLYLHRDEKKQLLTFAAYEAIKKLEGAIGTQAEAVYERLGPTTQSEFDFVMRRVTMVPLAEQDKFTRRWADYDQLTAKPATKAFVEAYTGPRARLFVISEGVPGHAVVSVTHEALLRHWPKLKDWLEKNRKYLRVSAEVSLEARLWRERGTKSDELLSGGKLTRARDALAAGLFEKSDREFIRESLRKQFRDSLSTGLNLVELSEALKLHDPDFPDLRRLVILEAVTDQDAKMRAHAATLLGISEVEDLTRELVRMLLAETNDTVTWAVAASLIQVNQKEYFEALTNAHGDGFKPEGIRGLAFLRAEADTDKERKTEKTFEPLFGRLKPAQRWRIIRQSWWRRWSRGWPTLFLVLIPAVLLSSFFSAIFKFFPGLFNYAWCQAEASGLTGCFHAVVASFFWGGIITACVALHHIVFRSELGKKSFLKPAGTLVAGAIGGMISSFLLLMVMTLVCEVSGTQALGWTAGNWHGAGWHGFWDEVLWQTRDFWPYMFMGTGLGVGMAMMANGLRASKKWRFFMEQQSLVTGTNAPRLIKPLAVLMLRFAWPIPVCMLMADLVAFSVVRTAPFVHNPALIPGLPRPMELNTLTDKFLGGLAHDVLKVTAWKITAWGQGLGIFWDSATQAVGGFWCLVGMGFGLIVIRYGVKIDPRKN